MAELTSMILISVEDLEEKLGVRDFPKYVNQCEQVFQDRIAQIADRIIHQPEVRAIFVSGPTASGKTTFSDRLARCLHRAGHPTRILSLDDYYSTRTINFDEHGRPDFETIDMLDTENLVRDLSALFKGQTVQLPTFDFVLRRRMIRPDKRIRLAKEDLIVIEGLHGLSDLVFSHLPREQVFGVFIMPWGTLLDSRQLIGSRNLRVLRRIARDVMHRGSTALSTIDYWPMIDRTEQHFFPPYLARADEYINSCLPYEFCIVPPIAARFIEESLRRYEKGCLPQSIYMQGDRHYADLDATVDEARELLDACARLPSADRAIVPPQSILQEFIH